jgi:hypothetical protein
MKCDAVAAMLDKTLLRERDPRWFDEAARHAAGCPSCSRLLEQHWTEERLADLPAVEPSSRLLETVMSRITQREPVSVLSSQGFSYELFKYAAIYVGALLLAAAYMFPPAGKSWLSNLWSAPGLSRTFGISTYFSQHPLWAIYLAGIAALLIVLGLAVPECPVREEV